MSTQKAFASYQEIIDLHTESDKVSVIGIHTPIGETPRKMFGGFFDQFKKFRYLGCSISFVPAARLPADPLQVSYEAGEPTIDPRDMLNPIMFHGCHGEDLGAILNKFYALGTTGSAGTGDISTLESDSIIFGEESGIFGNDFDQIMLESLYYRSLTDNTWKKAHPQRGFRKSGLRPLVYSVAATHQLMPGLQKTNIGPYGNDVFGLEDSGDEQAVGIPQDIAVYGNASLRRLSNAGVKNQTQFLTPRLTSLGWLDTYNVLTNGSDIPFPALQSLHDRLMQMTRNTVNPATLPNIYMGIILLPPAYKTEQYYRMIITHHFAFKQFRGISYNPDYEVPSYFNFNDPENSRIEPIVPDVPEPEVPENGMLLNFTGQSSTVQVYRQIPGEAGAWVTLAGSVRPNPSANTPNKITNGIAGYEVRYGPGIGTAFFTIDENNRLIPHLPCTIYSTSTPIGTDVLVWDPDDRIFRNGDGAAYRSNVTWDAVFGEDGDYLFDSEYGDMIVYAAENIEEGVEWRLWNGTE